MKPRTEKMTKPPNTLVAQLMSDTITASLNIDEHTLRACVLGNHSESSAIKVCLKSQFFLDIFVYNRCISLSVKRPLSAFKT